MNHTNNLPEVLRLRKHRLYHVPELRVQRRMLAARFASHCSMAHCNAACCRHGVMVDVAERDRIVRNKELIQKHMEPHQEHDPSRWFEEEEVDADFPSGRAVGTQERGYGCVFLDSRGRCVLQTAAVAEGMDKFALKPFFCVAFPVTIENGELDIDDPPFTAGRTDCCSPINEGARTIFDVCSEELRFVLGDEGLRELKELAGV